MSHRKALSDVHLRQKLLWIYFLLIVLPLGCFTFYAFNRISSVIQGQTFTAAEKTFDETVSSVEDSMQKLERVIRILTQDSLIYQMASEDPRDYTYIRQLEDANQLTTTFEHLLLLSGVDRIQLYVKNDFLFSYEQRFISPIAMVDSSHWYQSLTPNLALNWYSPVDFYDQPEKEKNWFSAVQIIYNPRNVQEPLAVLRADLEYANVADRIEKTPVTENSMLLLLHGDTVLLSSGKGPEENVSAELVRQLPALSQRKWETVTAEGRQFYVNCASLTASGWIMATVIPYDDIYRVSRELRFEMLLVVFAVGVVAYVIAFCISKSTLNRISLLTQTMREVELGNMEVRLTPAGGDEIGQLMGSFGRMMDRIQSLMDEKIEYGREIKNLELKALQAQINPHFLYNSLDLINCTAISRDVPEISSMVNALAKFYKLSLSRGKETIPLSDELNHAKLYIQIQNLRFDHRVKVHWDVEEELLPCMIIKIVLQPIIENAIIHGIFERAEKAGDLTIQVHRADGDICLIVEDNGVGMDAATLHANFDSSPPGDISRTSGGYGIRNISDRLRIAYGDSYGLSCKSTPGRGTSVTIRIPTIFPRDDGEGA